MKHDDPVRLCFMLHVTCSMKFMRWWHIVLIVIIASVGIGAFAWFRHASFSSQDVRLTLEGVDEVASGQEVVLRPSVENGTAITLTNVQLTLDLPSSLETAEGKRFAILHWDTIRAGEKVSGEVSVIGQGTGEVGGVRLRAEYSPEGFLGRFVASSELSIRSTSLPVTAVLDIPSTAVPGQEIEGSLHLVPQENLAFDTLFIEFHAPDDFVLREASPALDNSKRWRLEGAEKGRGYVFRFRGSVQGNVEEEENFSVVLGREQNGRLVHLSEASAAVRLSNAPLSITQNIEGGGYQGSAVPGQTLLVTLSYENNGTVDIANVRVEAFLEGSAFDLASVAPGSGIWDARTRSITWNDRVVSRLAELGAQEGGELTFSVALQDDLEPQNVRDINQTVSIRARISSPQRSLSFGGAVLESEDTQVLNVAGGVFLDARAYFQHPSGIAGWANSGLPLQVGSETTYTVVWEVRGGTSDVTGVQVEGALPSYVQWKELYEPSDAVMVYNPAVHTVTWEIGDLPAGTGSITPLLRAAFQVGVTPLEEHRGQIIPLVEEATASGTDSFAHVFVQDVSAPIDTSLPDDSTLLEGGGIVE